MSGQQEDVLNILGDTRQQTANPACCSTAPLTFMFALPAGLGLDNLTYSLVLSCIEH